MRDFPDPKRVRAGDVELAVYEAGPRDAKAPPIILVHGWPEIAYSWQPQLKALGAAGFRTIAIDQKGFGASDAPADKDLYNIRVITEEFAGLLDTLEVEKAIFCGHDWGGAMVWPMAQLQPDRVAGVIGVCTPHRPPPPVPPLTILEKRFGSKHYFIQFQEEGTAEALFETDVEKFFRIMFRKAPPMAELAKLVPQIFDLPGRFRVGKTPDWDEVFLAPDEVQVYVEAYKKSGFTGGINFYRNIDANYEIMKSVDPVIPHPSLWVGAADDIFLPPDGADGMDDLCPDLEKYVIEDSGHWLTWEQPEALNKILIDWLTRRFAG